MKRALPWFLFILAFTGTISADEPDRWNEFSQVVSAYPSRQLGQPGNAAIDSWVRDRFQSAVAASGTNLAALAAANAEASRLEAALLDLEAQAKDEQRSSAADSRPPWERWMASNGSVIAEIAGFCTLLLLIGAIMQRRQDALILALGFLVVATASGIISLRLGVPISDDLPARIEALKQSFADARRAALAVSGNGWKSGRIAFSAPAFVPGATTIEFAGRSATAYPLASNLVDPANLPGGNLTGSLINAGRGEDLGRAGDLTGRVAVLQFDSGDAWIRAAERGCSAIVIVEPDDGAKIDFSEAIAKITNSPVSLPRYFLPRAEAANLWGERVPMFDANATCVIRQSTTRWVDESAWVDWLFIPGTDRSLPPLHYQAFKDSSSIVPALAPGAAGAANLVVLDRAVRQWQINPPRRSVLISVVNDHANALYGERVFAFFAYAPVNVLEEEIASLQQQIAENEALVNIFSEPLSLQTVASVREDSLRIGGSNFSVKKVFDALVSKKQDELRQQALTDASTASNCRQRSEDLSSSQSVFSRFVQRKSLDQLTVKDRDTLTALFQEISSVAKKRVAARQAERNALIFNLDLRWETGAESRDLIPGPLDPVALITLDLQFSSPTAGLFFNGMLQRPREAQQRADPPAERVRPLARWILERADQAGRAASIENTILMAKGIRWQQYLGGDFAMAASAAHEYGVAALTLTDVRDQRRWAFTPSDTLASIDRTNFSAQTDFAEWLLHDLASADGLDATRLVRGHLRPVSLDITVRKLDEYSIELPDTRVPGALILGLPENNPDNPTRQPPIRLGEVSPFPLIMADSDGRAMLRGAIWANAYTSVFGYDDSFSNVTAALDFGEGEERFSSKLDVIDTGGFYHRSLLCFDARKTDLFGLFDPANFLPLETIKVLDARETARPRNFATAGLGETTCYNYLPLSNDGTGCVFIRPDLRFALGIAGAPVIHATTAAPGGTGFLAGTPRLPYIPLLSAEDMNFITSARLETLKRRGVTNAAATQLLADAKALKASEQSPSTAIDEAWSLSFQAYHLTRETISDLIRAVVIILALAIPFSYFVALLLSSSAEATRQLGVFMIVFAVVVAVLFAVQPAFGVSDRPMVIILAFVMIGLALFVGMTIYGRFSDAMLAKAEATDGGSFQPPQSRVVGVSFAVGVNNMKRRRMRSALTCATVALVTFTMLSVISVASSLEPLRLRQSASAPYNGLLLVRAGMEQIPSSQVSRLAALAGPETSILERVWTRRFGPFQESLPFTVALAGEKAESSAQNHLDLEALLGLSALEPMLDSAAALRGALLPGGRWFEGDDVDEILLSRAGAAVLGLTPENFQNATVSINGRSLKVVGLLDDALLAKAHDLRGVAYSPLRVIAQGPDGGSGERPSDDLSVRQVLRPLDYGVVPIGIARSMGNSEVHSVSVRFDSSGEAIAHSAWVLAARAVNLLQSRIAVGLESEIPQRNQFPVRTGEYILAPASFSEVGGLLKILIPTVLGATILLNTMLGSVMERRKEIMIYNSIGLNPTHITVFFLAESLVFGLVGSFSGYLIGQLLSLGLGGFLGINLNYSSISVVAVILLSVLTVLASTLYPSLLAARSSVPSGQRKWNMPPAQGDQVTMQFPFVYREDTVGAVQAYLHQFLMENSEASTGRFVAELCGREESADHQVVLFYNISPTPYDLGVVQKMAVGAELDPRTQSFTLSVQLNRLAGDLTSWRLVNQPFLESLRHHLLHWRSLPLTRQQEFTSRWQALVAKISHQSLS